MDNHKGMTTTTWVLLIILAMLLGFLGGYYYLNMQNKNVMPTTSPTPIAVVTTAATTSASPTTTSNVKITEKTYKNDQYKFAIDMSKPISQYTISQVTPTSNDKTGAVAYIEFSIPTTDIDFKDDNGNYMVEKIEIIPTSKYTNSICDPNQGNGIIECTKLGTSGDYTILAMNIGNRDNPKDLDDYFKNNATNDFKNFQNF